MKKKPSPLTPKEKVVLEFIEHYFLQNGLSPSYPEIQQNFELASIFSVQRYIKQLIAKGYIAIEPHQKRSIQILHDSKTLLQLAIKDREDHASSSLLPSPSLLAANSLSESICTLPLMGAVAAGQPLEAIYAQESIEVPRSMIRYADKTYALRVQGESMIEDGIFDQDIILVEQRDRADNGETVVAVVENEATVKKFFLRPQKNTIRSQVELRPANATMKSLWYAASEVQIKGVLVGLIRRF